VSAVTAYRGKHNGFGPAFAAGKLAGPEGIRISEDTLRRWLAAKGLRAGRQRMKEHLSGRERCHGAGASKSGYTINPAITSVPVYCLGVTFKSVTSDGTEGLQTTTELTLTFDKTFPNLMRAI
jgi:hypothetical protein